MSDCEPPQLEPPRPLPGDGHAADHLGAPHPYHANHATSSPDVVARLEWLDDLMFAAIDGDPVAVEAAVHAWKRTVEELGAQAVEESRCQYLRRAQSVWSSLRLEPDQPPQKMFAAIEIISLLAGRAR